MAAKKVAAIIVAALVAGVVMGTLGIANAGGTVALPGAAADCTSCPGETGAAAAPAADGAAVQTCPGAGDGSQAAPMSEGACGTGACEAK